MFEVFSFFRSDPRQALSRSLARFEPDLGKALETTRRMTVPQLKEYVLKIMRQKRLNGSTAATLLELDGQYPILMVGERHDNPDLCASQEAVFDVVKHVVLKGLRECEHAYLFLESFFHFLTEDPAAMDAKLRGMDEAYGVHDVLRCIAADDYRCQYGKRRGALTLLRTYKSVAQAAAMAAYQGSPASLNDRIIIFDVREDLGMHNPWELDQVSDQAEVARRIQASLARRQEVVQYLRPIARPSWRQAFEREVLGPYLALGDRVATLEEYRAYFIEIPDVVALNRLLALLAAKSPLACFPIFFMGDKHRENLLRLLRRMNAFPVAVLAEAKDPAQGSCAKPIP